ncbi:MAG: hypothetical protein LBE48_06240 [Methanomassiliicoccaceae archaeon]|jgi:hypothetical protein|nr:hypothetical protein [Methanomassiliicoccaceae archaeon]
MATQSFDEDLIIETDEQARILIELIDEAERRPPEKPMDPSISELLEEGDRLFREGYFDKLLYGKDTK